MYGSYGSTSSTSSSYSHSYSPYGSYHTMASPMDIAASPFSTRGLDATCAFPSWPRRESFCEQDSYEGRVSSYISDDDLLGASDMYEDDSSSNGSASPIQSPPAQYPTETELLEMQRERAAYQREVMRLVLAEKEKRKQQAKRRASATKKSKSSKLTAMTPISDAEAWVVGNGVLGVNGPIATSFNRLPDFDSHLIVTAIIL
ncbi:hypothetical protein QC763_308550 [Podospora pseudopauciseta]|uniref:Uncharacterized protein n=2 Tax=Podospora TaxID=5144 RepID=A0ABR0HHL2_9PEZI|nr:hypothetical protein QC763_308550 [Podospora pseudopauciseta]KAK4678537.1 hypothetical protein QC764_308550 [Podospora pseudoanserina]